MTNVTRTIRTCVMCKGLRTVDVRDTSTVTSVAGRVDCPQCGGSGYETIINMGPYLPTVRGPKEADHDT